MPDYREILEFLAKNPPQVATERRVHASMLELLANCLRADEPISTPDDAKTPEAFSHLRLIDKS